jgi:hypothetical protein
VSIAIDAQSNYTTVSSSGPDGYNFWFMNSGAYLSTKDGQQIARRSVTLPNLNILAAQSALTSASVQRNANLVPGKTTASAFIYETDPIAFATPLRPTLDISDEIDIATVSPSGVVPPVTAPLASQLNNLLNVLFAAAPPGPEIVQITASYRMAVYADLIDPNTNANVAPLDLPIYLLPPTAFQPGSQTGPSQEPPQSELVAWLNDGIGSWFTTNTPALQGDLLFSITVSSLASSLPMPLLRLENLVLHWSNWQDHPNIPAPVPPALSPSS